MDEKMSKGEWIDFIVGIMGGMGAYKAFNHFIQVYPCKGVSVTLLKMVISWTASGKAMVMSKSIRELLKGVCN